AALRTVEAIPERIEALVLAVPAGIARGSAMDGIFRAAIPLLRWRLFPTPKNLRAMVNDQFTTIDEDWMHFLGDATRHAKMDFRVPKDVTPERLARFKGPVYVFGAEDDVHFPGPAIIERAPKL